MSAFIDQHRERFGVEPICRTLDVSASAYYQRATGKRSERSIEDERLLGRIREVHATNFECYGYPRVWHELQRQGERVGRDHVARLMRQEASRAPSGAASRGRPRSPIQRSRSALISSSATLPPIARTRCGSATSPTCAAGRGACTSRS